MTHYLKQEEKKVEQGGQKLLTGVEQAGQAIINNPLPVIETLAVVAVLPEALPGLSAAQSAAISSAAVSAANGGNLKQIATAAATAGVGAEVTQLVAPEVGPTPIQGAAAGSVNPLAQAAGGAAAGATQAALTGQNVGKAALTGGAVGGLASAGAQEVSSALSPGPMSQTGLVGVPNVTQPSGSSTFTPTLVNPMTESPISYGPVNPSLTSPLISTAPTELANYNLLQQPTIQTPGGEELNPATYNLARPLTGGDATQGNFVARLNELGQPMIPTQGGLGIVGDPNAILPSAFAQYATAPANYRAGADGSLVPQYQAAADTITPGGMTSYNLPGEETPQETITAEPQTTPGLSPSAQAALQSVFGYALDLALAPKPTRGGGGVGGAPAAATGTTTGTTSATTGGAPGGTELDPSTGKAPQQVWGDKYASLKEGLGA